MTIPTPPPASVAAVTTPEPTALARRVGTMHVNGNKQYRDATDTHQRMSTLLKNLKTEADGEQLTDWKLRQVAIGMSKRPDLVLGVAAAVQIGDDGKLTWESKKAINGLCRQAGDAAGNRSGSNQGNAVHTATERLDLGETAEQIALPYPFNADLRAYETLKKAMRLTFRAEHIERSVRNRALGIVGTYDRVGACELLVEQGLLAPDELIVVDVKTEKDPLLNLIHIAPQLAGYANADAQFIPDPAPARLAREAGREPTLDELAAGEYEDMPNVSKTIGLVIHVRDGRATPYLVDLVEGWEAARAAAEQRERSRRSKIKLGEPGCWALPLDVELPPATALVQDMSADRLARDSGRPADEAPAGAIMCGPVAPTAGDLAIVQEFAASLACPAPAESAVVEQAVRGDDGMVTWHVVPDPRADPARVQLVEAINAAPDVAELARLYDLARQVGVEWTDEIATAGHNRHGIVECVQRDLHTGGGACACGWRAGMAS